MKLKLKTYMNDYVKQAMRTFTPSPEHAINVIHMASGMGGEFLSELEEALISGDKYKVMDEAGDIFWYNAGFCHVTGLTFTFKKSGQDIAKSIGVILEMAKKFLIYGKELDLKEAQLTSANINYELARLISKYEGSYEEAMKRNIAKLKARFPDKFNAKQAINKDAEAEKQAQDGVV